MSASPAPLSTASLSTTAARPTARLSPAMIATFAVVALFVGMRLWRLTDFALGGDEIFSVQLARDSWRGLFAAAAQDAMSWRSMHHSRRFCSVDGCWIEQPQQN